MLFHPVKIEYFGPNIDHDDMQMLISLIHDSMKAGVPPLNILKSLQLQNRLWEKQQKPVNSSVTALSTLLEGKAFDPTSYATTLASNADLIPSGKKSILLLLILVTLWMQTKMIERNKIQL